MQFPTLGPSSLPVVVAQLDERHANKQSTRCGGSAWRKTCKQNSFCVGVVWKTQSIVQHPVQTKEYRNFCTYYAVIMCTIDEDTLLTYLRTRWVRVSSYFVFIKVCFIFLTLDLPHSTSPLDALRLY